MTSSWVLTEDDASMSSARACALVLSGHHERFKNHWSDISSGDPTSIHQVRVSLRRAQSVLSAGKNVFPQQDLQRFSQVIDDFLELSSPIRDISVLHESLDDYANHVSVEAGDVIPLLHATLEDQYREGFETLQQWCASAGAQELVRGWQVLSSVYRVGDPDYGKHSYRSVQVVVNKKLIQLNRRILRDGREAAQQFEPELWHDLRQEVKQLRYTILGFGGLYPHAEIKPLLKRIRRFQNRLGDYQDASTQRMAIEQLGAIVPSTSALREQLITSPLDFQFRVGGVIEYLRGLEAETLTGVLHEWDIYKSKSLQRDFNDLTEM